MDNRLIRRWARARLKTNYWRLLLAAAISMLPANVWSWLLPLWAPALARPALQALFSALYYPITIGVLYCAWVCYHQGTFSLRWIGFCFGDRALLKKAWAMGAIYSAISLVANYAVELAASIGVGDRPMHPPPLTVPLNLLMLAALLAQLYLTLRLFLSCYLLVEDGRRTVGAVVRESFAFTKGTLGRQMGMVFALVGWALLAMIAANVVLGVAARLAGFAYSQVWSLAFSAGMLLVMPYVSVAMAGLASALITRGRMGALAPGGPPPADDDTPAAPG